MDIYALLDANVLLPARLSDLMMDLAIEGVYHARWSHSIEQEYLRNWGAVHRGLKGAARKQYEQTDLYTLDLTRAQKRLNAMRLAIGSEYRVYTEFAQHALSRVPEQVQKNDRHVAAGALLLQGALHDEGGRLGECYLVSNNLQHLAVEPMWALGVQVCPAGAFLDVLYVRDAQGFERAAQRTIQSLVSPPFSRAQLLEVLRLYGAHASAQGLALQWGGALD